MNTAAALEYVTECEEPQLRVVPENWTGKTGLASLVLDAVESVDWPHKGGVFSIRPGESFRSEMLMILLTYSYATGTYCSGDVEIAVRQDETLQYLCADAVPDWRTIRRFRRLYREPLRECLIRVADQALLIRFGAAEEEVTPADYFVSLALDKWFEPLCVPFPREEAEARLERAIFEDQMVLVD